MNLLPALPPLLLATLGLSLSALASAAAAPAPGAPLFGFTKEFFSRHCVECHDTDTQKGKVRLDNLAPNFTSPASAEIWGKCFPNSRNARCRRRKRRNPPMPNAKQC